MGYIIFTSAYSVITLCIAATLYVLTAVAVKFSKEKTARVLAILSIAVHIFLVLLLLYLKATVAEMLFVLVVSTVFSLVVRILKGEE